MYLIIFELCLGGTGQTFKLYGVTLRQFLFVLVILIYLIDVFVNKDVVQQDITLLLFFLAIIIWSFISSLIGLLKEHDTELVFGDLSPMLYFISFFPWYYFIIKHDISYNKIMKPLVLASVIVSVVCICVYLSYNFYFNKDLHLTRAFADSVFGKDILWFRYGGYVVYPGLTFVLCSQLYLISEILNRFSFKYFILYIVMTISIILSMTKGYILFSFLGHILILLSMPKVKMTSKINFISIIIIVIILSLSSLDFDRFTNITNDHGVQIRIQTLNDSIDKLDTFDKYLIGNGFGTELPLKKAHQENSFVDIVLEQGMIGLLFYMILFLYAMMNFKGNEVIILTMVSVFFLSMTNPFINNPLGISIIILSVIYIKKNRRSTR